ncbi:PREDICTED: putative fatty acyl-CoA reductase CG5065 [Polistes dominula]|uniref:Fatty acyl-CoA reductase n=1 Tax=Polistes dominula TaxID=743375 RepID=A0ABM1JA17_POLDO|nr:PREDICTED: putative fatty acyl-CoA reductase CG5065 [Polistes dominula]
MASLSGQTYQEELLPMVEEPIYYNQRGEIATFFSGKKIFITGGLGFIGRLIMEKLLRCCPEITTIYLLVRAKKQKDPQTRFKEYFNDVIFNRLKREQKDVEKKIILIEGDTSLLNLGLSEKDRDRIKDTDVIFHSAASVRFLDNIRIIVNTNIRGTRDLLLLAQEMTSLKAFVYVSTAYSHCVYNKIEENLYEPPMKTEDIIRLTEILTENQLDLITPKLLGKWPNTYAFSKAICEDTVRQYSNGIPSCIVRPSVVVCTEKEPIAGWINNLNGITGVVFGSSKGILRTLYCDKDLTIDMIPADYVVNNIIAAAWDVAQKRSISQSVNLSSSDNKYLPVDDEIPIYNSVSSVQRPITFDTMMNNLKLEGFQVPSKKVLCGRKPILLNVYRKIEKFKHVMSFFSMNEWEFTNDNVLKLWDKLSIFDKSNFFFNVADIDWKCFFITYIRGLRVFLGKDPMDTVEESRPFYRRLTIAHYTSSGRGGRRAEITPIETSGHNHATCFGQSGAATSWTGYVAGQMLPPPDARTPGGC